MSKRAGPGDRSRCDRVRRRRCHPLSGRAAQRQTLDFDFAKVTEQSRDNPVFYVRTRMRGPARCCGRLVMMCPRRRHSTATHPAEMVPTAGKLAEPVIAANAHEPHRVAFYLMDLAASYALWTAGGKPPAAVHPRG